ncbi:MAG: hypothetical protein ACUVQ2_04060, partial [Dissulfurimicrobium sp.]
MKLLEEGEHCVCDIVAALDGLSAQGLFSPQCIERGRAYKDRK